MRIAYVEDNAINLALVERVTRMLQHEVVNYEEGEEALVALSNQTFDLILMDIELAGALSGLEVVTQLRQAGMTTPIVALTAYAMAGDRERILKVGCNEYLPKPIPIAQFIELLKRYEAMLNTPQPSENQTKSVI